MNKLYFFLVLWSYFFTGCTPDSPLEQALNQSGKNRNQLEQVLKHYSVNIADSLKYKAACYLISNMPGHGWYEGEALHSYKRWMDSVYQERNFIFKATLYEAFFQQPDATNDLERYEDIQHLDSNFLITWIDSTFSAVQRRPWLNTLLFDQLCEYILPYRVGNERPQQLYRIQDSVFSTELLNLLNYDDINEDAASVLEHFQIFNDEFPREVKILYRGRSINYNLTGCVGMATVRNWLGKIALCPVALDLNPAFPTRNDRHCWSVMIDNKQMNSTCCLGFEINKQGKIYRHTFTHNPSPVPNTKEYIPAFFRSPFYQDVTSFYTRVRDVPVIPRKKGLTSYGYLSVFNNLNWEPVAYSESQDGQFIFKDIGWGIVYLPIIYLDEKAVAMTYPFILDLTGQIQILQPDTTHLITLKLKRKYPLRLVVKSANQVFLNSVVEASDDPDFRQKDSIGIFKNISELQWTGIKINSCPGFRYWRIRSPQTACIAECVLYGKDGESVQPALSDETKSSNYSPAFDHNPISYAFSNEKGIFQWDMGRRTSLSGIECLLRNDGNSVYPGHWYELYYHDGAGWCSLGIKEATERFVEFEHIPGNALLWLRDLTTGREERIFTYSDEKIHFW